MNIFNLLTKKKSIIGLDISDNAIHLAYFHPKKRFSKKTPATQKELILIKENINENIISEGIILDKESFSKILKNIWVKNKIKSSYVIISIPEDKIYSHIFPYPKTVNEIQLKEAIKLTIDFELPIKKDDYYISSENAGDSNIINEILISAIPKKIADDYIITLNSVGIKILALESHLFSIARSIKSKFGQAELFTKINPKESTIFILKDRSMRFSRIIPKTFIKNENFLSDEISHIKTWFEIEKKISVLESNLAQSSIKDNHLKYLEEKNITTETHSEWLASLGATMRGEIVEGKDNQISLLPIGTAEAYAYQKITIFITILRNITIGISMFFLLTFFATYLFVLSISKTSNKVSISDSLANKDNLEKETWINNVNSITSLSREILSTTPNWSILIDDINTRIISGIFISNFSVTSMIDKINIVGIAKDREALNKFKKALQESPYITSVELPLTNLGQKGDIPFSISFNLKDPNMLYYK